MKFTSPLTAIVLAAGGLVLPVAATVLVPTFTSCVDSYSPAADPADQINVTAVYASLVPGGAQTMRQNLPGNGRDVLRLDVMGALGQELNQYNDSTRKLTTLFATTWEAGVQQWESSSYLCNSIRPSNDSSWNPVGQCLVPPGDFGINISIPLYNIHELATLQTVVRIVDTNIPGRTVMCVEVHVTPYTAGAWPYKVFLWFPAAVAIGYWITTWAARFAAGWVVGVSRSSMARREQTMLKWGTMIISGLSGERFGVSGALLRFVTPGLRDIMFHIQFVTMLGMININWPSYFYPIVAQSAWADLLWNVSIVSTQHPTIYPRNFTAPLDFAPQMRNITHPLYLNTTGEDRLMDLVHTSDGILSFAKSIGLRPQDLFGTCLALFLMLAGGIVVIHALLWLCHWIAELLSPDSNRAARTVIQPAKVNQSRSSLGGDKYNVHSRSSSNGKEWMEANRQTSSVELNDIPVTPSQPRTTERLATPSKFHRIWKRFAFRGEAGAFHFSALYGNLLRLIITFHFPITAFSVYQLTLDNSSIVARVLAALALAVISVLIPAGIMYKISRTPTGKLYDAARTLLALGTVYNVYEAEKQLYRTLPLMASLIQGVVIGAGQASGLAQVLVLVIVELICFVLTTVWSPWGEGAGMGGQVILISILRIASLIMAMVLCHEINIEEAAQQWLTYAVLILQAVIFVFFIFMLVTKIIEGMIRLFGGAPFDESKHPIDGGIFAAIMDLDCFNGVRGGKAAARKKRKRDSRALQRNVSVAGSLTTQMMLDRHSHGVDRQGYPLLEQRGNNYRPVPRNASYDQFGNRIEYGHRPSLSDQGSLQSERLTDESHGRILDAWKPYDAGSPGAPSEKSMKRQSWNGMAPAIRVTDEPTMVPLQQHSRARSSSAVMEELVSNGSSSPPSRTSPAFRSDYASFTPVVYPPGRSDRERALRPPPLSIPRRRSLNNISAVDENDDAGKIAGKRRSWGSSAWLARNTRARAEESDSEDEAHGGNRRRGEYDEPSRSRGWKAIFSRRHRVMSESQRGEKMARKAAAVNESAAAFAGVPAPVTPGTGRFRVHRKQQSGDALAAVAAGSAVTTPLLAPPPASSGFRVHRGGQLPRRTPTPPHSVPASPGGNLPLVPEPTTTAAGPSFRVTRKGPSPSSSSISSPQLPTLATVPDAVEPEVLRDSRGPAAPPGNLGGYSTAMFRPLDVAFGFDESEEGHGSQHQRVSYNEYGHAI